MAIGATRERFFQPDQPRVMKGKAQMNRINRRTTQRGSAIVAVAVTAAILSIATAGFLAYIHNENILNYRSHAWTQALHLAEGGVEQGFAEYHFQYFQGQNGFTEARGWSGGSGSYSKTITNLVSNLSSTVGDVTVTVSGVGTSNPQIMAVASVPTVPFGSTVSRAVRVSIASSSKFPVALMSKNEIDLNGNNIYVDSFDSEDPNKSTGGLYSVSKRQSNGDVASNDTVTDSINIGNAEVYGRVYTGDGGTVTMGNNGSVGPTFVSGDRAKTVNSGEQAGWIRHDFNVDVPDVSLPAGASSWSSMGNVTSSTIINGGDWRVTSISLASTKTMTIQGNVRLYITGNTSVTGNASIIVAPGAKLEVYAAGSMSIAGNGVANNTGISDNNQWYGLPSSTSWSISGNGQWVGTVYSPSANFTMNGGGTAGDMSGAVVAKSITLNGHVKFHYDESLDSADNAAGYLVTSWQSLRKENGAWVAE
jgi:hypothetical protein